MKNTPFLIYPTDEPTCSLFEVPATQSCKRLGLLCINPVGARGVRAAHCRRSTGAQTVGHIDRENDPAGSSKTLHYQGAMTRRGRERHRVKGSGCYSRKTWSGKLRDKKTIWELTRWFSRSEA
jgi:hypothetical protein